MQVNVFDQELEDELNKLALPLIVERLQTLEEQHFIPPPPITKGKEHVNPNTQSTDASPINVSPPAPMDVPFDIFDDEMNRQLDLLAFRGILKRLETLKEELMKPTNEATKDNNNPPPSSPSDGEVQSTADSQMFPDY